MDAKKVDERKIHKPDLKKIYNKILALTGK